MTAQPDVDRPTTDPDDFLTAEPGSLPPARGRRMSRPAPPSQPDVDRLASILSENPAVGFRSGAIGVLNLMDTPHGSAVEIRVGGTTVEVHATPKGRRVFVNIVDRPKGTASGLEVSVFTRGRWWQPGVKADG